MITLTRFAVSVAFALCLGCLPLLAQTAGTSEVAPSPNAELAAFLSTLPKWTSSTVVKASYGFKDNLLLSATGKEQSSFARGSVEMLVMRVPYGRLDYSIFAQAEGTNYFSTETANHDAKVYLQTEPGFRATESLTFTVPVTAYYYDQVFDVSDTDVERLVAELKVRGAKIGPTVRWDFHPAWWVEAQAAGQRKRYDDGGNDGEIGEGSVRLGWAYGSWLEARLSGRQSWRNYDRRAQYSAAGRELADTKLKIAEGEGEVRIDITWDGARHWQTTTRASLLHYRDNGSGYFNYREQKVAQDVEWHSDPWLLRVGGSASRIDFAVQTIGVGIDPPGRLKDEFSADLHLERQLTKRWAVFAAYTWERSRSNERIASYTVNEGLLGVRWGWDK